jgi:hypothetical protein
MSTITTARPTVAVILFIASLGRDAHAAPITWIGGNADWDGVAAGKWNPADEPDNNDEAIFNTPNSVNLANATEEIQALTMSGGIDLNLNGNDMIVDGLVSLTGSSTNLTVGGSSSLLTADSVDVNADASLIMAGGSLTIVEETGAGSLDILAGGTLRGTGVITLGDGVAAATDLLNLTGTLSAAATGLIIIGEPPAGTLTINVSDVDGRVDLDQSVNAVVNAFRNQTLDINGTLSDAFSADMNLFHNSTIDIRDPWSLDSGTIDVDNGFVPGSVLPPIPAIPADTSFISGGAFTQTGGTITVVDDDGTLQFNALFTQTGGTVANNGLVVFNANATIGAGAAFNMPTSMSSITVNAGVTVNVDQANFNPDGSAAATNVITVNSGGILDLDLGAGADEGFGGAIVLNGGELDVTTADDSWSIDRTVNVGASTGTSQINGEQVTIASATITVGANSTLDVNADAVWGSSGNLVTNAGAVTRLDGTTAFSGNGTFTGAGALRTGGDTTFAAVTTIDMPAGTVDLDGADVLGNTVTVNANTTINAGTMASFGANTLLGGDDTLVLNNFASLTVNLTDPNAEWTLTSNGLLDINAAGGMLGGSGIQGSDFNMAGTADVSGNSIWGARTDISGTVTVAAAGSLNLRGGDLTAANVNRLEGGAITGAGVLRALIDEGLFGFGTIETDIEFGNNTELRADNGTLNVDAPIVDVGVIGTADVDGILDVGSAWNTNVSNSVQMVGGEIRGATITNDAPAGINGHGLLSARVINNTRIDAEGGGTLVVNTAGNNNDWDGAGNGVLQAASANLELVDNATFLFSGDVIANNGFEVFANGFQLDFAAGSSLALSGGTFRSTHATRFSGAIQSSSAPSTLAVTGTALIKNTTTTTLNSDLQLDNTNTFVEAGAAFSGGGALVNLDGSQLTLADGADVGVLIENQGVLEINGGTEGRADADDYQQSATGQLNIDLAGTGLNDFDRLVIDGAAQIAGALDLTLVGTYVPSIADPPLTILSATGGVTGMFTAVDQPATMPAGLLFDVIYTPTMVQLDVVSAPIFSADFDLDGDVDGDDLAQWRGDFGVNDQSDADDDGDSDGADFLAWQQQVGSVPAVAAAPPVPEPAGFWATFAGAIASVTAFRRSRRLAKE